MSVTRRIISSVRVDDYIPQAVLCIACKGEVDLTTAHHGRVVAGWHETRKHDVLLHMHNGEVHKTPIVTEHFFPTKITGYACHPCYLELFNTTWHDKSEHLRRAFESVMLPVEQPKNDDHEASPITKGLYAPHIGKRKGKVREGGYLENTSADRPSAVLSDVAAATADRHGKLQGFNRPESTVQLKPKRVVVRNGRWKEDPAKYDYKAPAKAKPKAK